MKKQTLAKQVDNDVYFETRLEPMKEGERLHLFDEKKLRSEYEKEFSKDKKYESDDDNKKNFSFSKNKNTNSNSNTNTNSNTNFNNSTQNNTSFDNNTNNNSTDNTVPSDNTPAKDNSTEKEFYYLPQIGGIKINNPLPQNTYGCAKCQNAQGLPIDPRPANEVVFPEKPGLKFQPVKYVKELSPGGKAALELEEINE
jgi:hypothetical protein